MNPLESIVPIVSLNLKTGLETFLGTGFFLESQKQIVTANHVISVTDSDIGIFLIPDITRILKVKVRRASEALDLAILEVPEVNADITPLKLTLDYEYKFNEHIVSVDYGTTEATGKVVTFNPATRLGNITRRLDLSEMFDDAGKDMLEISFPALQGSSGAPILSNKNHEVLGMIVRNVQYNLIPTQIETVVNENNVVKEETKYLMPLGLAVHAKHIKEFIDSV